MDRLPFGAKIRRLLAVAYSKGWPSGPAVSKYYKGHLPTTLMYCLGTVAPIIDVL